MSANFEASAFGAQWNALDATGPAPPPPSRPHRPQRRRPGARAPRAGLRAVADAAPRGCASSGSGSCPASSSSCCVSAQIHPILVGVTIALGAQAVWAYINLRKAARLARRWPTPGDRRHVRGGTLRRIDHRPGTSIAVTAPACPTTPSSSSSTTNAAIGEVLDAALRTRGYSVHIATTGCDRAAARGRRRTRRDHRRSRPARPRRHRGVPSTAAVDLGADPRAHRRQRRGPQGRGPRRRRRRLRGEAVLDAGVARARARRGPSSARALAHASEPGADRGRPAAHRRRRARSDARRRAAVAHPQGVRAADDAGPQRGPRDPAPGAARRRVGRRGRPGRAACART